MLLPLVPLQLIAGQLTEVVCEHSTRIEVFITYNLGKSRNPIGPDKYRVHQLVVREYM